MINYIYEYIGWGLNNDYAKRNYPDITCET